MKIIYTTIDDKEIAKKIAKSLVEEKLAKCVQISNITSVYEWKNKIEETQEYLLIIKTSKEFEIVKQKILQLHNYELPEIIYTKIDGGYKKYLEWLS